MSRPFPKAAYAEDQRYSYTILTTHTLHRGFQTGALFGLLSGATSSALAARRARLAPPTMPPLQSVSGAPLANAGAMPLTNAVKLDAVARTLRATGLGGVWGVGLSTVGLGLRMWGRERIEWQDRSWRLLHNEGQVLCDDFSVTGTVVGGLATFARERGAATVGKAMRVVGGMGAGNLVGVMAYMVWRYGIKGEEMDGSRHIG